MMVPSTNFSSSDGSAYELQMGRWSRRLAPLFLEFTGIERADSVLDVGCGTGNLSFCLAQNQSIGAVEGVDLSVPYIEHATRMSCHARRIGFRVGDACALPFSDASFDHALSMLALQFVPQAHRAVREMRRVTRPGGTVAVATWDTRGGFVAFRMFFDTAAMVDPEAHGVRAKAYSRPMSRPGDVARAFHDAGLAEIVEDTRTIRMDFESFEDFWAPHEGREGPVAEYVRSLRTDIRTKLRDAVERAYLDGEPNGPRSYAATAWVVKGTVPHPPA